MGVEEAAGQERGLRKCRSTLIIEEMNEGWVKVEQSVSGKLVRL